LTYLVDTITNQVSTAGLDADKNIAATFDEFTNTLTYQLRGAYGNGSTSGIAIPGSGSGVLNLNHSF
jgi:hypothetical protein